MVFPAREARSRRAPGSCEAGLGDTGVVVLHLWGRAGDESKAAETPPESAAGRGTEREGWRHRVGRCPGAGAELRAGGRAAGAAERPRPLRLCAGLSTACRRCRPSLPPPTPRPSTASQFTPGPVHREAEARFREDGPQDPAELPAPRPVGLHPPSVCTRLPASRPVLPQASGTCPQTAVPAARGVVCALTCGFCLSRRQGVKECSLPRCCLSEKNKR